MKTFCAWKCMEHVMPYVSVAIGSKDSIPKSFITRIQRFHYNPSRTTMAPGLGAATPANSDPDGSATVNMNQGRQNAWIDSSSPRLSTTATSCHATELPRLYSIPRRKVPVSSVKICLRKEDEGSMSVLWDYVILTVIN